MKRTDTPSLTAIVTEAQQHNTESFHALVDRFQDMAYALAYGLTKDRHLAEDAAQESFIEESDSKTRDSRIIFNRTLFSRRIYPAIDPVKSGSRLLDNGLLGETHRQTAAQVKTHIHPSLHLEHHEEKDQTDPAIVQGVRVHRFCVQPYFVVQGLMNTPGEYTPIEATIAVFETLL